MNLSQPNAISPPEPLSKRDDFVLVDTVFRDYDIRGLAYSELDEEFALRLGRALGQLVLKRGQRSIYIARDGRLSSAELTEALSNGLRLSGCEVINLGESTTPILNFAIHHRANVTCGVMVTASHNPGPYNGFKIVLEKDVISGHGLQELKAMMSANHFPSQIKAKLTNLEITPQYLEHIISDSRVNYPFKLVIDGGNAVAGQIAVSLFERLGCVVEPLFCEVDGNFPNHDPNPSDEKNLKALITKVKATQADLGLAFDGDGDRIVVVTGNGKIVWPDRLMMIFVKGILQDYPGSPIVFDVKSSKRLTEIVEECGGVPVLSKTGHAHIRKSVREKNALIGGEFSGHIFFNDRWSGFDDRLYAAVRLLEILCDQEIPATSLNKLVSEFRTSSYTPEILVPVLETEKFELMDTLTNRCLFTDATINRVDGMRVEYEQGWGLVRPSNTTPNLTLRFEAEDEIQLEEIKRRFREELRPFINHIEDYI